MRKKYEDRDHVWQVYLTCLQMFFFFFIFDHEEEDDLKTGLYSKYRLDHVNSSKKIQKMR